MVILLDYLSSLLQSGALSTNKHNTNLLYASLLTRVRYLPERRLAYNTRKRSTHLIALNGLPDSSRFLTYWTLTMKICSKNNLFLTDRVDWHSTCKHQLNKENLSELNSKVFLEVTLHLSLPDTQILLQTSKRRQTFKESYDICICVQRFHGSFLLHLLYSIIIVNSTR